MTEYEKCLKCGSDVCKQMMGRHLQSHIWALRNNIQCRWCKSYNVKKNGYANNKDKLIIQCRNCGKSSYIGNGNRPWKQTDGLCKLSRILRKHGYTYRGIVEFMCRSYGLIIHEKTAWNWVNRINK